ncbi:MAG: helix-turn-helix domain-containing protein [Clostridia bacterium]|nr:helix-turn-helix domain-containing protein [Clostridia bacterium]
MILRESHIASDDGNILVKVCEHSLTPEDKDLSLPSRSEIELVRILSGVGICRSDNSEADAIPGDLFVFPGHAAHSFRAKEPEFRFLQIRFDPRFIWDGAEGSYDFRCVSFLLRPTAGISARLPRANPANTPVGTLMERIAAAVSEEEPFSDLEARALTMQVLSLLLRHYDYPDRTRSERTSVSDVERGLRYMNANFRDPITVDDAAKAAGMSKSYFMKVFRDLNGITPWEYVLLKRVSYATNLLKTTKVSVLDVAMQSGFNTKSSFNRAFRRVMKTSPAEYRSAVWESEGYGGNLLKQYHLAVDLGASSGRLILGGLENGKIVLEEVYRFENNVVRRDGHLCWDYDRLFTQIINGLRHCKDIGKIPVTMAIDTWGVDYVLLDEKDRVLGETYAYRDSRTVGIPEKFFEVMSEDELYARTGCQAQAINTLFQLYETKLREPEIAARTKTFLMFPEYLNFLLTGVKMNEYTNSSTTNMLNCETGTWDEKILDVIGFPKEAFGAVHQPCREVGVLKDEIAEKVGFSCRVILAASHDTASAVLAVPTTKDNVVYISSGTWSIFGTELDRANTSKEGFEATFTNEGGCGGKIRYLRNINGMWFIQSVRRELDKKYSFGQLADMAAESKDFPSVVDVCDPRFLAPESMITEIKEYCRDSGQPVPATVGEIMQAIYAGLSAAYGKYFNLLKEITGRSIDAIHIVGGGSKDDYLDNMTAKICGVPVLAGPTECSSIGNILSQMICEGVYTDITSARKAVADSFELKTYKGE